MKEFFFKKEQNEGKTKKKNRAKMKKMFKEK